MLNRINDKLKNRLPVFMPYDLSQSPGVPGQVSNPVAREAKNLIVAKAGAAGKNKNTQECRFVR